MARLKKRLTPITDTDILDEIGQKDTKGMLRKAWEELPDGFTMGDRTLFIELAQRLIEFAEDRDRKIN